MFQVLWYSVPKLCVPTSIKGNAGAEWGVPHNKETEQMFKVEVDNRHGMPVFRALSQEAGNAEERGVSEILFFTYI